MQLRLDNLVKTDNSVHFTAKIAPLSVKQWTQTIQCKCIYSMHQVTHSVSWPHRSCDWRQW